MKTPMNISERSLPAGDQGRLTPEDMSNTNVHVLPVFWESISETAFILVGSPRVESDIWNIYFPDGDLFPCDRLPTAFEL